jgi:hypothetical protein
VEAILFDVREFDFDPLLPEPIAGRGFELLGQVVVDQHRRARDQHGVEPIGFRVAQQGSKRGHRTTGLFVQQVAYLGTDSGGLFVIGDHHGADLPAEGGLLRFEDFKQGRGLRPGVSHHAADRRCAGTWSGFGDLDAQHAEPGDGTLGQFMIGWVVRALQAMADVAVQHRHKQIDLGQT